MIVRIDGKGLLPLRVAQLFASKAFKDGPKRVDERTFYGVHVRWGFTATFMLIDEDHEYGMRWFKRRGREYGFYLRNPLKAKEGAWHAMSGLMPDQYRLSTWDRVAYLDGYLAGISRKLKGTRREELECNIYTEIESLLYD